MVYLTQTELDRAAREDRRYMYIRWSIVATLIIGACVWASKPNFISRAVDQELGVYGSVQTK